jgi:hypothetical protein
MSQSTAPRLAVAARHNRFNASTVMGGSLGQPGEQQLAGVSPGRQQRLVAEHLRVAGGGTVRGRAMDLTEGQVQIDRHRIGAGTGPQRPGLADRLGDHPVELADVTECERAEELPKVEGASPEAATPPRSLPPAACRRDRCGCRPPRSRPPTSTPCGPAARHPPGPPAAPSG